MNAKFKQISKIMKSIKEEIQQRKLEKQWYKFRIEKILTHKVPHTV